VIGSLHLTVLLPGEVLLDGIDIAWVQVQLADGGGIGIYPGHAPLLAETVTAPLRYADDEGEHTLDLVAGILHVDSQGATILTTGEKEVEAELEASSEKVRFQRLAGWLARRRQG
jgi:F-type H+-transporting ATPase subunit epsilon